MFFRCHQESKLGHPTIPYNFSKCDLHFWHVLAVLVSDSISKGPVPPGAMQRPSSESFEYPSMGSFGHPVSCAC